MSRTTVVSHPRRQAIGSWRLHPGHAMSLRPHRVGLLRVYCGRVWVTFGQAGGASPATAGDRFLGPGDVLAVPAGARLVMEPLAGPGETAPVHFDWSEATQPPEVERFRREVLAPAHDLRHALAQVALATARVLMGLLGYRDYLVAGRGRVLSPLESLRS